MGDLGIHSADIEPYRLRLTPGTGTKYGAFRQGRLISLRSNDGITGWGDAAPLPGFSVETLKDIDRAWPIVVNHLALLCTDSDTLFSQLPAALIFALEQALLSVEGQRSHRRPSELIAPDGRKQIRINGLVDCPPDEVIAQCRSLISSGCSCIKLKVGHWPAGEGAAAVAQLRKTVGPEISIRLDSNRAWSLDVALRFLEGVSQSDIAYIEEPLADPSGLPELAVRTVVPLALDESLVGIKPTQLSDFRFASHLIVKPTIIGGIRHALALALEASSLGMTPVISSSFESGVGTLWLVALCSSPLFDGTAGLDTYRHLQNDVLQPRLELKYVLDVAVTDRLYEHPVRDD